jgi:hypothetical protein
VPIYDLFISYSSKDRPWAARFHDDLAASFPQLRIFYDRNSIPAGYEYRPELQNAVRNSKHLIVFWSKNADTPNSSGVKEVDREISDFIAHSALIPELEDSRRKLFYVPLDADLGGGIAGYQGFPDFKSVYDRSAADLGLSGITSDPGGDWKRMIREVGSAIQDSSKAKLVIAGIIATNETELVLFDSIHSMKKVPEAPSLADFLAGFGLTWKGVRTRYGKDALDWRPEGTNTVVTLLEEVRVRVNAKLTDPADRFQWKYADLTKEDSFSANIKSLFENPSVVIFDPVSLYGWKCPNVLGLLRDYVIREDSVIIALSPNVQPAAYLAGDYLAAMSNVLEDFFQPKIPPGEIFAAGCALDVQRTTQIDPLIRHRIRYPLVVQQREARREAAKGTTRL